MFMLKIFQTMCRHYDLKKRERERMHIIKKIGFTRSICWYNVAISNMPRAQLHFRNSHTHTRARAWLKPKSVSRLMLFLESRKKNKL